MVAILDCNWLQQMCVNPWLDCQGQLKQKKFLLKLNVNFLNHHSLAIKMNQFNSKFKINQFNSRHSINPGHSRSIQVNLCQYIGNCSKKMLTILDCSKCVSFLVKMGTFWHFMVFFVLYLTLWYHVFTLW